MGDQTDDQDIARGKNLQIMTEHRNSIVNVEKWQVNTWV